MINRSALIASLLLVTAAPASAQRPPAPPPPRAAAVAPPIDPTAWWNDRERVGERFDPLGDRRVGRNAPRVTIDNGVHPLLYRLWGLPPLQTMVLRDGEVVMEVWSRRPRSSREAISRITVRRDGSVFLQARAGLGCCTTQIGKRIDIDEKLEVDPAYFRSLARDPAWNQPTDVIAERPGVVAAVCVEGSAYDLTLLDYRKSRHVRRMCEDEQIGQVALLLSRILGAAMGKDPRFDVVFPRGVDFVDELSFYQALLAEGGRLKARSGGAGQPQTPPPEPQIQDVELAPDEDEELGAGPGALPAPSILNP